MARAAKATDSDAAVVSENKPLELPNLSPFGENATHRDIVEELNQKVGLGNWYFDVKNTNYPPGFVSVDGVLVLNLENNPVSAPGVALLPYGEDPNKTKMYAVATALRVALRWLGYDVEIPAYVAAAPAANRPASNGNKPAANNAPADVSDVKCADCDNPITGYTTSKGTKISAERQIQMTTEKYEVPVCNECGTERWKAENNNGGNRGGNRSGGGRSNYGNRGGGNNYRRNNNY